MKKRSIIPTEHQEQCTLVEWLQLKKIRFFAIPNGGYRHGREAKSLEREGVCAGVPDLCIPIPVHPFHGLYIELKRKHGGKMTDKQGEWMNYLNRVGYVSRVCYGCDEAQKVISNYLLIEQ